MKKVSLLRHCSDFSAMKSVAHSSVIVLTSRLGRQFHTFLSFFCLHSHELSCASFRLILTSRQWRSRVIFHYHCSDFTAMKRLVHSSNIILTSWLCTRPPLFWLHSYEGCSLSDVRRSVKQEVAAAVRFTYNFHIPSKYSLPLRTHNSKARLF